MLTLGYQSGRFYHQAGGIVCELANSSLERSERFVDSGLVAAVIAMMNSVASDYFLLCTGVSVFATMLEEVTAGTRIEISNHSSIMEHITTLLEVHDGKNQVDSKLYRFSCMALGRCFNPGLEIKMETIPTHCPMRLERH